MSNWATVEGYLGRYAISDAGEVLSMDFRQSGLPGLLKPRLRDGRYLAVVLYDGKSKRGKAYMVHLLVAAAFLPPKPTDKHQCNHADGIRTNNHAGNLEWMTGSENMKHAFATGLQHNRGERHSQRKLMEADVRKIRELVALGLTQKEIAASYGLHQSAVSKIAARKAWPHVATNMAAAGETLSAVV